MNRKLASHIVRSRYNRIARVYDLFEAPMETMAMAGWRCRLLRRVQGPLVLEAGLGTGKNLPLYPAGLDLWAIDVSERMLERSRRRSGPPAVHRMVMDVETLGFRDHTFDTDVATFLFCSVADPVRGLSELRRVVKQEGRILLLEHVRPGTPWLGTVFDWMTPPTRGLIGPELNRDTVGNVRRAGLTVEEELDLFRDIVKLLVCRK